MYKITTTTIKKNNQNNSVTSFWLIANFSIWKTAAAAAGGTLKNCGREDTSKAGEGEADAYSTGATPAKRQHRVSRSRHRCPKAEAEVEAEARSQAEQSRVMHEQRLCKPSSVAPKAYLGILYMVRST